MNVIDYYNKRKIVITLFCFITFAIVLVWNLYLILQLRLTGYNLVKQMGLLIVYLKPILISAISCFAINLVGTSICDHIILLNEIKNQMEDDKD